MGERHPNRVRQLAQRMAENQTVFLLIILTAQLMVVLDATVVNVALPHIQHALGFSASGLSWVLNAYVLTFGGLLLLGARTGDLAGRRKAFLVGILIFSLSSLAGGLAVAGWMLIAARTVQGIGGALAAPAALSLLTAVFPEGPQRIRAIALYTAVSAAGGAIGLVAGGLLTELVSWRWVMFVNVPIGLLILVLGRLVLAETHTRPGRLDLAGAISSTLGMTGVVLGFVEAGSNGWTSPIAIASLVSGIALLGLFVRTEAKAEEPILPLQLLRNRTRNAANAARGFVYAGMYGTFFFMSQFLQDIQHYTPLSAGFAFLPMPFSVFLSSQLASRVLIRRLRQKTVMLLGIGLSTVGLIIASQIGTGAPYGQVLASLLVLGSGAGISFVSLTTASLHDVRPEEAGAASGLINVSQQLGAAVGLAVLVNAFGLLTHHVQIGAAHGLSTVMSGLHGVFGIGVGFAVVAFVLVGWSVPGARRQTVRSTIRQVGPSPEREEWFVEEPVA